VDDAPDVAKQAAALRHPCFNAFIVEIGSILAKKGKITR